MYYIEVFSLSAIKMEDTIKIVIIGDAKVGKSCLLSSFIRGYSVSEYTPTVFDNYTVHLMQSNTGRFVFSPEGRIEGQTVTLNLWDTGGLDQYSSFRQITFAQTDIFIIAFSLVDRRSFCNVKQKWLPEIKKLCPSSDVPKILVGLKEDLRNDPFIIDQLKKENKKPVTYAQGHATAQENGCFAYEECNSLTQMGMIQTIFETIVSHHYEIIKGKEHSRSPKKNSIKELLEETSSRAIFKISQRLEPKFNQRDSEFMVSLSYKANL